MLTIVNSLLLVTSLATELEVLFIICGMILNISEDYIAANIRPLEGALEDLILNVALTMQGYEKMAFAATIAVPIFCK